MMRVKPYDPYLRYRGSRSDAPSFEGVIWSVSRFYVHADLIDNHDHSYQAKIHRRYFRENYRNKLFPGKIFFLDRKGDITYPQPLPAFRYMIMMEKASRMADLMFEKVHG